MEQAYAEHDVGRAFRNAPPAGAPARASAPAPAATAPSAPAPAAPAPPNTAFVAVDGAGPEVYQRLVKSIRWRALPEQMKHNVLQICMALKEDRTASRKTSCHNTWMPWHWLPKMPPARPT